MLVCPSVRSSHLVKCWFVSVSVIQLVSCAVVRCYGAALRCDSGRNEARSAAQSHLNGISAAISQDPNILELIPKFTRTSLLKFLLPIRVQETELKDLGGNLIAQDYLKCKQNKPFYVLMRVAEFCTILSCRVYDQ